MDRYREIILGRAAYVWWRIGVIVGIQRGWIVGTIGAVASGGTRRKFNGLSDYVMWNWLPIVGVLAQANGIPAAAWAIPVTLAASCDFMFPMSTPPNAIAYGTGWVKARDMFTIGFLVNIISFMLLIAFVFLAR
jgi:hypothetical protein